MLRTGVGLECFACLPTSTIVNGFKRPPVRGSSNRMFPGSFWLSAANSSQNLSCSRKSVAVGGEIHMGHHVHVLVRAIFLSPRSGTDSADQEGEYEEGSRNVRRRDSFQGRFSFARLPGNILRSYDRHQRRLLELLSRALHRQEQCQPCKCATTIIGAYSVGSHRVITGSGRPHQRNAQGPGIGRLP